MANSQAVRRRTKPDVIAGKQWHTYRLLAV